jgi:hypothetical protein
MNAETPVIQEPSGAIYEYRSKIRFLGLPLVHVRSGRIIGQPVEPAIAWIAIGQRAYGILFAAGGMAVGTIAAGGLTLGVFATGGMCLGMFAFGGLAIGGLAYGGVAIGMLAIGGAAAGFVAAEGGLAIAQQFALGGKAIAMHANDAAAQNFFHNLKWLDLTRPEVRKTMSFISWLPLMFVLWKILRLRKQKQDYKAPR